MRKNREIKNKGINFLRNTKVWIKKNRSTTNQVIRLGIGCIDFLLTIVSLAIRIFTDKGSRAIFFMRIFKSKRVQQTTPFTCMNRYPVIFLGCRDYVKARENIKILSYGCSTGEEVLTLREYFPNATIIGAEINNHSLEICRKLAVDEKIKFVKSTPSEIKKHGNFDIVFCMAVLQRTPHSVTDQGITSLKKIYPFEKFEQQIVELDQYVNQGGLLVLHFTQYSFIDTIVASKYKAFGEYSQDDYRSAVFDKNSHLIKEPTPRKSVFIKQQA